MFSTHMQLDDLMQRRIDWTHTGDAEFPYTATIDGQTFIVRLNDFPAEPLYTVLLAEEELGHLDDWPSTWVRPEIPKSLLDLLKPRS